MVVCRTLFSLAASVILLASCMGSLGSSAPPRYFEVDYSPHTPPCAGSAATGSVRVWPFSASPPFDREEMIVLDSSHRVRLSPQYRWITNPGAMTADRLLRDLAKSSLFTGAVNSQSPFDTDLELGGHVFRFAWEEKDGSSRAVLDVEVSLWRDKLEPDILFRRQYHFASRPFEEGSPEGLAEAMGDLMRQLSSQVMEDLCAMPQKK